MVVPCVELNAASRAYLLLAKWKNSPPSKKIQQNIANVVNIHLKM